MITRRLKRMQITPELIVRLGRGTFRVTGHELPEDVVIMASNYDGRQNVFEIMLHSEQWPEVAKHSVVPVCDSPFIERLDKPIAG